MVDANSRSPADRPQEYPAVRTTIVGGRPPGCGKALGPIPRGIEVLVKKAAVDPEFKLTLMQQRAAAADAIGLVLEPAEETMLNMIPAPQLAAIIARTTVDPRVKPAFLGRAAAVMLVALGASAVRLTSAADAVSKGERADPPTTYVAPADKPATTTQSSQPATKPPRRIGVPVAGAMPGQMDYPPPAEPLPAPTTQASQPTTWPAVTREQIMPILKQLDSQVFKERAEAQKKIQDLGWGAFATLQQILKSEKLSLEVVSRIKTAMWSLKATTRPALLNPQRPTEIAPSKGMSPQIGVRADVPARPTENPED